MTFSGGMILVLVTSGVLMTGGARGGSSEGVTVPRPEATLLELLSRPFAPTEGASQECIRDSKIYFAELRNYNPWALQMFDASAKMPPGVITGNVQQLGNYDECLQIKTDQTFKAQACSASVQFEILKGPKVSRDLDMKDLLIQVAKASNLKEDLNFSVNYEWMWCVPSSCNYSEISEALELALDPLKVDGRLDFAVDLNSHSCHTDVTDQNMYDFFDWTYIGVLLVFAAIIIASTAYDLHKKYKDEDSKRKDTKHQLLTAFSLHTNGQKLLSTKRSGDTIPCLDGLRYLSICWIIYGHTFYLEVVGVKLAKNHVIKMHEDWSSLLILNGNIVTDTFFLLSGILLAYTLMAKKGKDGTPTFSVINLYLNRYLRLTPAYAIIVGFYATLFEKLGSGPKWDTWVNSSKENCRANWWINLLYVNNYVNLETMCMSQSWYLSVDMQLLWISPLFLYPMLKCNKAVYFWVVTGTGLLASILIPFGITYFLNLTGTMLYYKNLMDVTNVYLQIYTRVYTRAGPYIIGLAFGYILFKTKNYKIRMNRTCVACGWLVATAVGLAAVLGPRAMYFNDYPYNKWEASFYAGLHRHVFTGAVAWIIFACINGYAGPVNTFLSWRVWVPLSKLTYSAYLTHYIVLLYNIGSARTSGNLTGYSVLHTFFGNLCLTMFVSLCLSCCFEMPFMTLVRLALVRRDSTAEHHHHHHHHHHHVGCSRGLQAKPSSERFFGSTDSGESIYRSSEDLANTESAASSVDSVYAIGSSNFSVVVEPKKLVEEEVDARKSYTDIG
ncbi:nose resistant to fluoxetine protein 6-like [Trichogramma pretiosum]|uniref:nose resistant to fluoxetine protein 6-like n=1 Tax=Trichogramma pretiosum TaxID=7493 RepID=UPI0006C9AFDC|nr:nose resistant to fluoxetine protein 6-like [Trichogramma pretiosum]